MIADLSLTSTGDLILKDKPESIKKQKITFNLSKTNCQKININFINVENAQHNSNNYLKIDFMFNDDKQKIIADTAIDTEALIQLLKINLNTVIGELPERKSFGSKLTLFRHANINDNTLGDLERYTEKVLSEYLNNVKVKAKPIISYTNGYKQTVNLDVYSNDHIIFNFQIER